MSASASFDIAVIGAGIKGCTAALFLARGGMRVVLVERDGVCRQASGVNAGTLSVQVKETALVPYAMRSNEMWEKAANWLGVDVGFRRLGGLSLAFTEEEAALLERRVEDRRTSGAPIDLVGVARAREIEPALSHHPILASYCPLDGYSNTTLIGAAYRAALLGAGVDLREGVAVETIERAGESWAVRTRAGGVVTARRILLTGGIWLSHILGWLGFEAPVICRINQVSVTERTRPTLRTIIGVVSGFLSVKQVANGTILIGGGWQGIGDIERGGVRVIPENLLANIRLARHAVPALAGVRVVRTWLGMEGHSVGYVPIAGPLPGHADAFVLGLVRGGYTIGPYIGKLMADAILGREPEMALFDPAKLLKPSAAGARSAAEGAAAPRVVRVA